MVAVMGQPMPKEERYSVETTYKVTYTNQDPVPIDEIVKSLLAFERILKRTPDILETYYKGVDVESVDVFVNHIESGSLIEDFVIRYVFKGDEKYEDFKESVFKLLEDNEVLRTLVAMTVGGAIVYGLTSALPSNEQSPSIDIHGNTIINIGAEIDLSSEDIKAVLSAAPKQLAKDAIDIIKPAKRDPKAEILVEGQERLNISRALIKEAPAAYVAPQPVEKVESYENITVFIYASDRDSNSSGWAGIIDDVAGARVKISLDDEIDPKRLHGKTKVRANVDVISKYNKSKRDHQPKEIVITKVL